jgi:hypothetical protein
MAIDPELSRLALAALDAKAAADELVEVDARSERLAFSLLYRIATNPYASVPDDFAERLQADPTGKETFARLLEQFSKHRLPAAAAASSGDVSRRETRDLLVTLVPSLSREGQVYVLFEVRTPTAMTPTYLRVLAPDGEYYHRSLPQFDGEKLQIVLEHDDPLLGALRDPASELFLI